ncbi:hypothetical protein FQN54_009316 [Arachnomyces sp. PD_36]|nr:hypothetical protein FQN54_009316 [Arachnomyces sp. PD_36]
MAYSTRLRRVGAFLAAAALLPASTFATPAINVGLKASFNSAPYLVELLETAAEENSTCYFPLLDRIAEGTFLNAVTDKELYDQFIDVLRDDGHLRDEEAISSFKFALSMHSTAPRIEAHYQYYTTSVESSMMVAQDAACPVWVHTEGKQYCSPALVHAQQDVNGDRNPKVLPFDRVLGDPEAPSSILYADVSAPMFHEFHQAISESAREGQVSYRVRYRPSVSKDSRPLFMNGYGVELALKRTDYIVIDDRASEKSEEPKKGVNAGQLEVEEAPEDLKPLSSSEVLNLGLKASSFVMNSQDPFDTLLRLSQDFPKHSSSVAAHDTSEQYLTELLENKELMLPPGRNIMWLNGAEVDSRKVDAFSLLEKLRTERSLINRFRALGFTGQEAISLLSDRPIALAQLADEPSRYDYRDDTEGGNVIIWLNDIEKDKRYREWPDALETLLQRTYPGQMPQVRRNMHNVVVPVDLTNPNDIRLVVENLQMFVRKRIGIRFGFVPSTKSSRAIEQIKVAHHLLETYGLVTMLHYLEQSLTEDKFTAPSKSSFDAALIDSAVKVPLTYEEVVNLDKYDDTIASIGTYQKRLAMDDNGRLTMFANGVASPRDENWIQAITARVGQDLQTIQRGVFEGAFSDDVVISEYLLGKASRRRNPLVAPEDPSDVKVLDIADIFGRNKDVFDSLPRITVDKEFTPRDWSQLVLAADLDSAEGTKLVSSLMEYREQHGDMEVTLLHNAAKSDRRPDFSVRLHQLVQGSRDLDVSTVSSIASPAGEDLASDQITGATQYWEATEPLSKELGLLPGQNALVLNGRIVGPIPSSSFGVEDIEQLVGYEQLKRLGPVSEALSNLQLSSKMIDPSTFAKTTALIARSGQLEETQDIYETGPTVRLNQFEKWSSNYSAIATSNSDDPSINIVATIDPTTPAAQRWIPILKVLSELSGVQMKIFLSPREELRELPIKRFYRQVLESAPSFDEEGYLQNPQATFNSMPGEALLNLGMDVPPAWLVAPVESIHDPDNIKLSSITDGSNVDATYELEHILIQGHSRDTTTASVPRGVQLLLGTDKDPHFGDTIIMYNLGYFQFKAQPGHYKIKVKPGRSEQIFKIDSIRGTDNNGGDDNEVTLLSFQGETLFPRLSRKPGHEEDDVLDVAGKAESAMDYVSKGLNFASDLLSSVGVKTKDSAKEQHADINIFSVASGHLYERMLSIMMVSVMRHTEHTVKFWFIEQFLSPSFKSLLPHLAKEYGFSYEMVTYKWPHWLRGQTEKQREIWGYKILFLDVLFPLSLDKVIFVDADQIVRTDMYDLVTLDLEGAPYGFTPMCDSRTSMDGFRFWKQGYWEKFLRDLPYHISALYVVDLNRFRELAAGDRMRGQYQQLSADPNSLSNLDQDLPNHMQHNIPIKSLPQEWLWCETWCADEDLEKAKTIDLCNNPETKEPKLDRARRQVPEWTVYDDEIAAFAKTVEGGGEGDEEESGSDGDYQPELEDEGEDGVKEEL